MKIAITITHILDYVAFAFTAGTLFLSIKGLRAYRAFSPDDRIPRPVSLLRLNYRVQIIWIISALIWMANAHIRLLSLNP